MEFPVHPIQETGKRPTAALDRNLCLYRAWSNFSMATPLDGVVLTIGCDKTTPALPDGGGDRRISPPSCLSGRNRC